MQHLLLFARHPERGRVKTRLAQTIGADAALAVYRELVARTRAAANGLTDTHKTVWFAEAPSPGIDSAAEWAGYAAELQPSGDLGAKMTNAFAQAFADGATAAVIIGTDCPDLTTAHLQDAFTQLRTHDLVVGPAEDGGYYLLGLTRLHAALFEHKTWSTDSVLADTLADARALGLRVAQLPMLADVDTEADLLAWRARAGR